VRGAFVQHCARRSLGFQRPRQQKQSGNRFAFQARHAQIRTQNSRRAVERANCLERRPSVENSYGLSGQIGAQAQQGLRGKLLGVHAGMESLRHAHPSRCAAAVADHTEAGGFF
jgi:hypothetical protein